MTRNAVSQSHQLNVQYGSKKSSSGVFLNYTDNQGIVLNTGIKLVSGRFTHDSKPLNWLSTAMNMMVNHTWQSVTPIGSGGMDALRSNIEMPPLFPIKFPDGTWSNTTYKIYGFEYEAMANPVHYLNSRTDMRYRTHIMGNAALTFYIAEGLELKTQFGMNSRIYRRREHQPFGIINHDNNGKGKVNAEESDRLYWQEETFLTYKKVIDRHRLTAMVGLSWMEETYSRFTNDVGNFTTNAFGVYNLGAGSEQNTQQSEWQRWAMNSYFTRLAYTFSDKYSFTFTARVDGSSKFGANNKYAFFPSGGVAWNISNEDFMKDISWIDNLKLHTSYGVTGNSELPMYRSLAVFSASTVLLNGTRASAASSSRMANPDLRWEKTKLFDIGFNLNMLKNRLNFDVSWYYKYTDDLLLEAPIPITSGYQNIMKNVGALSNKGWDIMVTGTLVSNDDFSWNASLNANYNANKIEKLNDNNADIFVGDDWLGGQSIVMRVGEPLACFWGFERLGIKDAAYVAEHGGRVGTAIRSANRTIIGRGMPDWTGSFINRFRYKNFDFLAEFQFVVGGNIRLDCTHTIEDRFGLTSGIRSLMTEAWTEGKPTDLPNQVQAIRIGSFDGQDSQLDSRFVSSASYLRGRHFEVGYNFPAQKIKFLNMSSLRAFVNVNNLFVICDKSFKGYDPEVSTRGQFEQNVMNYQYPVPRTFSLGVNVTF